MLRRFNKILADNGGDWLVGASITYADIATFQMIRHLQTLNASVVEALPALQALKDRVAAQAGIAAYLAAH